MILVTGAAGFIGQSLVDHLGAQGVICADPADSNMLTPEEAMRRLEHTDDITMVYHMGAISSTTETNMLALTENNVAYSLKLLYLCLDKDIPLVYASSASVYGAATGTQREDQAHAPINGYAISKSTLDNFASQIISLYPDAKVYGLRYFNVYGHHEHHKGNMASPVHKFTMQARDTGKIQIFEGSENYLRDFINIEDVVKITIEASNLAQAGVYNVGTGVARSFLDVAKIIAAETGAEIQEIPFPNHLKGRYQTHTCSDNTKIADNGYTHPCLDLETGIKNTLALI